MKHPRAIDPVLAFNDQTTQAFLEGISFPTHVNRFWMSYEHRAQLQRYCLNPNVKCTTNTEQSIKRQAADYLLVNGVLYGRPGSKHKQAGQIILAEESFATIVRVHQQLTYAGYRKTFAAVEC